MKRQMALLLGALLLLFAGCRADGDAPTSAFNGLCAAVSARDEKACAEYPGKKVAFNLKAGVISRENVMKVSWGGSFTLELLLQEPAREELRFGDVIAVEGIVSAIEPGGFPRVTVSNARVVADVFTVSGEIEGVYHDWEQGGREYGLIWENGILPNRQLAVYFPVGQSCAAGDRVTATGKVRCTEGFGLALLPQAQAGAGEMLLMQEPEAFTVDGREGAA